MCKTKFYRFSNLEQLFIKIIIKKIELPHDYDSDCKPGLENSALSLQIRSPLPLWVKKNMQSLYG